MKFQTGLRARPPIDRFLEKIDRQPNGCWLWTAGRNNAGYGLFRGARTDTTPFAHRWSYLHFVGPIPDGLVLDHLCRTPACVNPDHLEPVTAAENVRRSPIWNGNKTHCKYGHELTEDNVWRNKNGDRNCRICWRRRARETYARQQERKRAS